MNRTMKFLLALTTFTTLVLCLVVWSQSNRIQQLERVISPERNAKAVSASLPEAISHDAVRDDFLKDAQHAAEAEMRRERGEKVEELAGEIEYRLPTAKANDASLCRLSRNDETMLVTRLQAVTGTRYHNFEVAYWSSGTISVCGVAPVIEFERVKYELRSDPSRKNRWHVFRAIEQGDASGHSNFVAVARHSRHPAN